MKLLLKRPLKISPQALTWSLALLAALAILLVASGLPILDLISGTPQGMTWSTPAVTPSTPTPTAVPGWWEQMPTPQPVSPTTSPGDSP